MPFRLVPAAAILALLAACSPVRVKPSGVEGVAERSPDCPLEFLNKAPGRPYDELGELESHVTAPPPGGAREALRPDACRLGADAIIVTKDFVTNEFGHALVRRAAVARAPAGAAGGADELVGIDFLLAPSPRASGERAGPHETKTAAPSPGAAVVHLG